MAQAVIPPGRRAVLRGEHLFVGQKHVGAQRKRHLWAEETGAWGTVVACAVCGRIRQGETMLERSEPIVP